MSDKFEQTNETEFGTETEEDMDEFDVEEDDMEETATKNEPKLRERVFFACESFEQEGKKVTRDAIRAVTRGSDRDVSRYIKEWKEWKEFKNKGALAVQGSSDIEAQAPQQIVQTVVINQRINQDADKVRKASSTRATNILVGYELGTQHFLENPSELDEELQEIIAQAKSSTDEKLDGFTARYEVNFFAKMVISGARLKE